MMYLLGILTFCLKAFQIFGCECKEFHQQKYFCDSDIAIKTKVLKLRKVYDLQGYDQPSKLIYTVSVLDIYKNAVDDKFNMKEGDTVLVITPGTDGECRVLMNENEEYLIVGKFENGAIYTMLCGWNVKYDSLTDSEIHGLKGDYDCECQVFTVAYGWRDFPSDFRKVCMMGLPQRYSDKCLYKYGSCQWMESQGRCVWHIDDDSQFKCLSI